MLTVTAGSASELFAGACRAVLASGKPAAPPGGWHTLHRASVPDARPTTRRS
jgi:hypothetical protein